VRRGGASFEIPSKKRRRGLLHDKREAATIVKWAMRPKYIYPRKELGVYADKLVKRDHDVEFILITGVRKIGVTSIVSHDRAVRSHAGALHLAMDFKYYDLMPPGGPSSGSASFRDRSVAFASYVIGILLDVAKRLRVSFLLKGCGKVSAEVEYAKDRKHNASHKAGFGVLRIWEGTVKGKAVVKRFDIVVATFDHLYWNRKEVERFIEQTARVASDISKRTGAKTVVTFVVRPNVFNELVNSDLDGKYNIPTFYGVIGPPSLSEFTNIVALHGFHRLEKQQAEELYKITGGNPFVAIEYLTYARWGRRERFLQSIDGAFNVKGVVLNAKKQGLLPKLLYITENPDAAEDFPEARALLMKEGLLCRAYYSYTRLFMRPENVKTKYFWTSPLVAKYIEDVIRAELGVANRGAP